MNGLDTRMEVFEPDPTGSGVDVCDQPDVCTFRGGMLLLGA